MKGGASSAALGYPAKRRWRCLAAAVLFLVVLSMLVPLVFLLGLYNGFHSAGYTSDQQSSSSASSVDLGGDQGHSAIKVLNHSERDTSNHVYKVIRRLVPIPPTEVLRNHPNEENNGTIQIGSSGHGRPVSGQLKPPISQKLLPSKPNSSGGGAVVVHKHRSSDVDSLRLCELSFGSYCLWLDEHREDMKDFMVKKLKDKLFVARAYFPTIAKLPEQSELSRELRQNIQEFERILSESSTDTDLPPFIEKKLQKMEASIAKAKTFPVECSNVDKKLRQILDLTEDEANFHMKQSAFLYQLAVQTMPKSLHCLLMRLTVEYFKTSPHAEITRPEKYSDPSLQHYVILSKNVLASSVVINSTVLHARESGNLAFHVLTDAQNYFAMKLWFLRNTYKKAVVEVINIEDVNLDNEKTALLSFSLPVEFRVTFHQSVESPSETHLRTDYLSTFSHSHYLLPYIFPKLKRIVVLDDDVVVQRDLTELWSLKMGGKVVGAAQLCSVRFAQLSNLFGDDSFDRKSCPWMSGLNVIDLVKWRELELTKTYQDFVREVSRRWSSEAIALRANLLTFRDLIHPLDDSWVLSGLGHDYALDPQVIKHVAVLHYNGNLKPWLELGIPRYKPYWRRFFNREDSFLADCNVNS
ncbi:unnamed protein product [Linum trigynum]|uniref:Hexosyltransferase n=1 Tax=Linum trigynum TaxID=586398 RepID=A0AAV2EG48_9ROSI